VCFAHPPVPGGPPATWPVEWFGDSSLFRDANGAFKSESEPSNVQAPSSRLKPAQGTHRCRIPPPEGGGKQRRVGEVGSEGTRNPSLDHAFTEMREDAVEIQC